MLALAAGASFVARGFSGDPKHLEELISKAVDHEGFAFIDVLSPCVSFNKINTYSYYKSRVYRLEEANHDATNLEMALEKGLEGPDKIPIGIFYHNDSEEPLHKIVPGTRYGNLVDAPLGFNNMGISENQVFDEFR